jgi:FtsP/CotA-like multicopper oxidase with cupredoxin domain
MKVPLIATLTAAIAAIASPTHARASQTNPASACAQSTHIGTASPDLYCVDLVPTPGLDGITAHVALTSVPSPFGVAVNQNGNHLYGLTFDITGLPDPATLGDYTSYVAWVTTPLLFPTRKLGVVGNGTTVFDTIDFDQFLILVSAEANGNLDEREGRLVLRGGSPSTRMQPPDLMEFLLGATRVDTSGTHHMHGASLGDGWVRPPMPAGITMLPALMALEPPDVTPYLPDAGKAGDVHDAVPRRTVRLNDGDTLSLEANFVRRTIRGRTFLMYGFNGQYPGPLIWVPQDATIHVNFTNRIDWPTSVHWHGVRLENAFDGVPGVTQEPIQPGETFYYRIHFRDAGLYWYHPHHREDVQKDLGLYGNMMVRSSRADYYSPANREEVLMLDDILMTDSTLIPFGLERATHSMMGRFGNVFLMNGEPEYEITVDRGTVIRLFLTNVSNTRTFNLALPGARLKAVGSDVGTYEREQWVDQIVISPAERFIIHAQFLESGSYPITNRVQAIDHINGRFIPQVDTLGWIHARPEEVATDLATSFNVLREDRFTQTEIDEYRPLFDRPVDHHFSLTMEANSLPFVVERLMQFDSAYFNPVEWSGTMPMMNWASTGEQIRWILRDLDTGRENEEIEWQWDVGQVVKIRVANERQAFHAMQHPIHIHGQRFLVLEQNGVTNTNLVWKDTMLLPVGSSADILLELSNPGRWMIHCHISEHLESGMKTVFTVN